ncbi:3'-5' exonuclease [Serratia marcescens]|uniref:3'-5' exonuclease n=1 Tax=Serratia marcescens TaxID=615 RepID=UPI00298E09A7|nr:3'-5' exonuclease [Serratia marcescens]MDW7736316.1 3'-5' exonuclease [Serratia marcescens]
MTPQQQAQQWLRDNVLIMDTETTGLGDDAEIVEVTIIDTAGRVLLNTLVKPRSVIPASATAIHGITNEMVATAPSWPHVCRSLYDIISGRRVVIYNSDFDTRILDQTNDRWWITIHFKIERPMFECAMLAYAEFYGQISDRGGYKWQKLTSAAEQQGVIIEGTPHRALSDCLTTLGVIKAMAAGSDRLASHGIAAQKAVDILNRLLQVDHAAITALVNNRVFCSDKLAKETSVGFYDGYYLIGMVGIINALVAPDTIGAIYDDMVLIGFEIVDSSVEGGDL